MFYKGLLVFQCTPEQHHGITWLKRLHEYVFAFPSVQVGPDHFNF